jgi:cytochrome P450
MVTLLKAPVHFPPGPKGDFLTGSLPDYCHDPLGFLRNCTEQYGDIIRFRFGPIVFYLVNHPDYIEEVMVTKNSQFLRELNLKWDGGERLFGNGLLTSTGDFWRRQRRLIQPAFHRERIATYADVMVEYTNRLLTTWQPGEIRDVHQEMINLTLVIVAKTLFDADVASEIEEINTALEALMQYYHENRGSNTLLLISLFLKWLPTPDQLRFQKAIKRLDEIVYGIIHQHRTSGKDTGDLLSMLLQVQDEDGTQMTDQQLRDEVMTLLMAGHETTANALSWIWMLLSQNPVVEAKLLEELQVVLGGQAPTMADLPQLRYTERVVMESMRLYPPAWAMGRKAVQDCEIGGYSVPAGTQVLMSQWLMHRDSRYFDNPEQFEPDRWADDLAKRLPTYAYFPFGGGSRVCIGKSLALMELTLVVATIAQKFQLTLVPEHPIVLQPSITLGPKHGIKMLLTQR